MTFGAGDPVWLERRKWPDSHHYSVAAAFLGDDEHGTWLASPVGTRVIRPDGSEVAGWFDVVSLVPRDEWFLLHFWYDHPEVQIYVDICTPPVWSGRGVKTVDLDLDVVVWNDGRIEVVDEDEFAEHRVALAYPDELVAGARRSTDDVVARLTGDQPPFATAAAAPWLAVLRSDSRKS